MADKFVPIMSATLRQTEEGKLVTDAPGGGGGTASDSTTNDVVTVGNSDTVLLLAANPDRKGFIIYCASSLGLYLLFGGVDAEGAAIVTGQPGAVTGVNYSTRLVTNGSFENGPGSTLYTGAMTAIAANTSTVFITEFE